MIQRNLRDIEVSYNPAKSFLLVPKLGAEGPVSVMTFGLCGFGLFFWRFSPGTQVMFGHIGKSTEQNAQLDKRNILLSHLLISDKYNLSSGKIEL